MSITAQPPTHAHALIAEARVLLDRGDRDELERVLDELEAELDELLTAMPSEVGGVF